MNQNKNDYNSLRIVKSHMLARGKNFSPKERFYLHHFYPSKNQVNEKRILELIKDLGVDYWTFGDGSKELIVKTSEPLPAFQVIECKRTDEEIGFIRLINDQEVKKIEKIFGKIEL